MQEQLKERIFPNLSIKLRPPSPNACDKFNCNCKMCKVYQKNKLSYLLKTQQDSYKHKFNTNLKDNTNTLAFNFQWILNRIMLPTHKMIVRQLQIYIPEVLFYKQGQPQAIYMNKQIHDYRIKKIKKQKLNQTYLQKIFNDRRRKYRDQVMILLGQKVIDKKQSIFAKKQQKIDTKDAAVLQFTDGSQQLITQNQLINLMLKRKQDPVWKKIQSIKNFITSKQVSKRLIKLSYNHNDYRYIDLFQRAKTLMRIYGGNIIKDDNNYISDQSQRKFIKVLINRSLQVYAQYVLYKIINFIDYFYDQKINHITCSILINQFQRPYLVDVHKLQTITLVKYKWTNEIYMKKIVEEQNKMFFNDKQIQVNPEIQQKSKILQTSMIEKYQQEKDKYGLTIEDDDTTQEKANDRFFSFLHPQFKLQLSSVLKDPYLTVSDFKKNYLGYTNERKSIIKPYTSNFIKNLHRMTPKLKVAEPHRLQYSPFDTITQKSRRTLSQLSKTFNNSARQTIDIFY